MRNGGNSVDERNFVNSWLIMMFSGYNFITHSGCTLNLINEENIVIENIWRSLMIALLEKLSLDSK